MDGFSLRADRAGVRIGAGASGPGRSNAVGWARMKADRVRSGVRALNMVALAVAVSVGFAWGLWPGLAPGAGPKQATAGSGRIPGVKTFPMDFDAGSMALHALGSGLDACGHWSSYYRLVALSGAGLKFVYDTTEAYEPLRDLFPIDVLRTAANAAGFSDARWEAGRSIPDVKALVKSEIDQGRPLLASFLKNDAYHGFFLIVGYDFDAGVFYLQGALRDSVYASVPIPERWDGPTAGPAGWADNPVFVLGAYDQGRGSDSDLGLDKAMITLGISLLKGGKLTYGLHQGERAFMHEPGPHEAVYGIPAYRALARDVAGAALVVSSGEEDEANFGLIWRLDAQLGQLEHDRTNAATAIGYLVSRVSEGRSIEVEELVTSLKRTATDVAALRQIFWDQIPYQVNTPDKIIGYVKGSNSMIFSFAGSDRYFQDLKDRGLRTFKTRWGPVIIEDSPDKRLRARMLVRSVEARERTSLALMEGIEDFIAPDLGVQPPEPRTGGPRRRR